MEDLPAAGCAAPEVPGYDVGRLLGRGGTAAVWLVTERSTGREFALKCFEPGGGTGENDGVSTDREAEEAMRREVRILSALDHEHLLRAHTVLRLHVLQPGPDKTGPDTTETLGLVLEYAPGGSVADLVTGRGQLGAGETVTVLAPIAQALQYLHSHGFTHGDVSPGNVLFTAHGKPLLSDVGVARMAADAGADRLAGTEGFTDPSPVDAVRAGLQPERDVYSLAALGWYCLTGRAPVPGAARPPLPLLVPGVPAALAAALEAGLDEDRRKRPSAADLAAAVYRSTAAEPVDLSVTAHPSVAPQLLTRRAVPRNSRERRAGRLRGWLRPPLAVLPRRAAGPAPAMAPGPFADADTGRREGNTVAGGSLTELSGAHARTSPVAAARHAASEGSGRHSAAGHTTNTQYSTGHNAGHNAGHMRRVQEGTRPETGSRLRRGTLEGRRRGRRKLWAGAAVALSLFAGLCAAWLYPGGTVAELFAAPPPASAPPAAPISPAAPTAPAAGVIPRDLRVLVDSADPVEAVRGLAALRSLAFNTGNVRLLEEVNVPASAAADADARIGARLSAAGHVLSGFETTLARVQTVAGGGPGRTVVAVSAVSSPYQERDAAGLVVAEAPAGEEIRLRLVLASIDGRWRIAQILAGDPASG